MANHLGDYLRARRGQVTPQEVGLVPGPRRRVAGLRRDELAMLAGISSEYLQRLEQGRDRHPSVEVLDAIARALRMDEKAVAYLHQLANPVRRRPSPEQVAPAVAGFVDQLPTPALIVSRYQDVLAANALAEALSPGFCVGQNLSRWRFLEPAAREVYPDWDDATAVAVGGLRELSAADPDDPVLMDLIAELSGSSERFKQLWEQADVGYFEGVNHMRHPVVGDVYLTRIKFDVPHSGGQHLLAFHAEPGSPSAAAVERLRTLGR